MIDTVGSVPCYGAAECALLGFADPKNGRWPKRWIDVRKGL